MWEATGIGESKILFLDLYGLLAASEVAQAGQDPFQPNALDVYHRPHVYTTWWLATGPIRLDRSDTRWLGLAFTGLSLVVAVLYLRPRRFTEGAQAILVLCSPAFLMAVNRGNNDWVILVFVCAALGLLRSRSPSWRALSVILLAVAAVLKYYPLAAIVLLLAARSRREMLVGLALYGFVLVLAWPGLKPGLANAARFKPHPEGLYAMGAPTLCRDFGVTSPAGWLALAALLGAWGIWLLIRQWRTEPVARPDTDASREFACGAVMLVGCFFLGASFVYTMIFAVWLLPWLWRERQTGAEGRWQRACWWLLLGVLWAEGLLAVFINRVLTPWSVPVALKALDATLVIGQLFTWALVACLLRSLVIYAARRTQALLGRGSATP